MTQSRKEQVKNLKTKYIHNDGNSVIFGGGSPQIIDTGNYAALLAALQVNNPPVIDHPVINVGGVETDSPAMITGSYDISLSVASGNQFFITIPGVNGSAPFLVTIQPSDVIILKSVSVVTVASLANRINTEVAAQGVPVSIAFNIDGALIIKSANLSGYTYGDDASITFTDITPGVILKLFGTAAATGVPVRGTSAPKRGIITRSADGLGGFVQVKNPDGSQVQPVNSAMIHTAAWNFVPAFVPGSPVFARISEYPFHTGFKLSYYQKGLVKPSIITNKSDFTTLTVGDLLFLTINYNGSLNTSITIDFGAVITYLGHPISTINDIITGINHFYGTTTLGAHGVDSTKASVKIKLPGPCSFTPGKDSFYVQFDSGASYQIVIPNIAGAIGVLYNAVNLASLINGIIGGAGIAYAIDNRTLIIESLTAGSSSSVSLISDSANPDPDSMLDAMGVAPGFYTSGVIASAYGSDEIQITCPSIDNGASLIFSTSSPATAVKLGLNPAGGIISVQPGLNLISVSLGIQVLIPEMLTFSEVPDNNDVDINTFNAEGQSSTPIDPTNGTLNAGLLAGLFGPDGKINPNLISKLLGFLGASKSVFGSDLLGSLTDQLTSRITIPHDPGMGPVLIWTGSPLDVTLSTIARLYLYDGALYFTINARIYDVVGSPQWSKDNTGIEAYLYEFVTGKIAIGHFTAAGPFTHADWLRNIKFNSTGLNDLPIFGQELLKLGENLLTGTDRYIPRINLAQSTSGTDRILLLESVPGPNLFVVRIYINSIANPTSGVEVTVNARWNGATWNKDQTGIAAYYYGFTGAIKFFSQLAANNAPWLDFAWDTTIFSAGTVITSAGTINLGYDAGLPFPSTIANYNLARLSADRSDVTAYDRTLLLKSADGGTFSNTLKLYLENADAGYNGGSGGDGFTFVINATWVNTGPGTGHWHQDNAAYSSSIIGFVSDSAYISAFYLATKTLGSPDWADGPTNWDTYDIFTLFGPTSPSGKASIIEIYDGFYSVNNVGINSNPAPTDFVHPNSLYAKSMVKSWGRLNHTLSNPSPTILDGFNIASVGPSGGTDYSVAYTAAMSSPPAVVMTPEVDTASTRNLTLVVDVSTAFGFDFGVIAPFLDSSYPGTLILGFISIGAQS